MKTFSKKIMVSLLAVITALCAFFGVLLISPQTVSADEAVATASTVDYSTWKKTQLNVGDKPYNKIIMIKIDESTFKSLNEYYDCFFSTTGQSSCSGRDFHPELVWYGPSLSDWEELATDNLAALFASAADDGLWFECLDFSSSIDWAVYDLYPQTYTFYEMGDMCECGNNCQDWILSVTTDDTITAIAEGVTLYELTEPIHANYDLTAVQTLDHAKYTQENAITEETNFANAWIRLYNGLSNNVFLGGVDEGWSLNAGDDHQLFYSSADLKDVYYFKLPTVVTDEYVDVYIPSGTFISAEKYELTIPTALYVDNLNYAQYETHVKVLSMPVYEVTVDFEMPNTVNYIESDVEYMDNIAGKYIRVYEGKDVWIYTSKESIANMHALCTNGVFKIISADGTYYDVTLPSNVGDGYVDVYIPIGTFTDGEYTFELIDTYFVGNYEEQLKVLTAPAEVPSNPEEPEQPEEPDNPDEGQVGNDNADEEKSFSQKVVQFFKSLSTKDMILYLSILILFVACIILAFRKKQ